MNEKVLVPEPPEPFVVEEKVKENLRKWENFFKNLSPRIQLVHFSNNNFDLGSFKVAVFQYKELEENDEILDWPEEKDIAFGILINSALSNQEERFKTEHMYIFCYNNIAFSLTHFERDEYNKNVGHNTYSFRDIPEEALSWEYITKKIIIDELETIEKSVPELKLLEIDLNNFQSEDGKIPEYRQYQLEKNS